MNFAPSTPYVSVRWSGDALGTLELLDQTLLPDRSEMIQCADEAQLHEAIVALRVRGAPAIGIAAAYGVVLALQPLVREKAPIEQAARCAKDACAYLATSRPTAVNLFWALDRMQRLIDRNANLASAVELGNLLLREARNIHDEDRRMCHAIGEYGASLFEPNWGIVTHCNTGGLATAEFGTALAAILTAHYQSKNIHVFADETRPLLQDQHHWHDALFQSSHQ